MATDFVTLYTAVMNRLGVPVTNTTVLTRVKQMINEVSRDVSLQRPWRDLQRRATLILYTPVTTGLVDVTRGVATVAGGTTSPTFTTNAVAANMKFKTGGHDEIYTVSSVGSEISLTLTAAWQGVTATDAGYTIWKDEYALAADFARPVNFVNFLDHLKVQHIGLRELRERYPWPAVPGNPRFYTLAKPATGDQRVWNVILYPPPDERAIVPYEYISSYMAYTSAGVGQATLSADTDEPWMDERYRHILILGTIAEYYRDYKDDAERFQQSRALYEDLIRRMANDEEPTSDRPRLVPDRSGYAGLRRARYAPRYDLHGNFDRMR